MTNRFIKCKRGTTLFAVPAGLSTLLIIANPPGLFFHFLEANALYILLSYLGLGLALYFLGRTESMFVSFACCALLCYTLQERSACDLGRPEAGDGPRIKVAHFDLEVENVSADSLLGAILHTDADIVSIQGTQTDHFSVLHAILTSGPYSHYQFSATAPRPPGLAIYSRLPLSYVKKANNEQTSTVLGRVELDGGRAFHFISLYFLPARNQQSYRELQRQIRAMSFQARQIDAPLLVFGKYNLKPWSRTLREYKDFSRLQNSRRGMQPTWPHGYLDLADDLSDHIFFSNHFKCIRFETISCGAEPHLGICSTFEWVNDNEKKVDQWENTEL